MVSHMYGFFNWPDTRKAFTSTLASRSIDNLLLRRVMFMYSKVRNEISERAHDKWIIGFKSSPLAIFKFHQQHQETERKRKIRSNLKIGDDLRPGGRIGEPTLDVLHVHLHSVHPVAEVTSVIRCHQMMADDARVFQRGANLAHALLDEPDDLVLRHDLLVSILASSGHHPGTGGDGARTR